MTTKVNTPPVVLYLDHTAKWSGGEIALLRALEAVDTSRVTPVVLLAEDGPFAERLRAVGIETHVLTLAEDLREVRKDSLGGGGLAGKAKAGLAFAAYAGKVARFGRKRGAALLHCNSLKSDIYGAIAGRLAGIPVLWHVRDHIDPSYLPGKVVKVFRILAARWPDYVVCNSESSLAKLFPQGHNAKRARAIHDGLADRELTSPLPTQSGWKNDPPMVGIVGRLVEWKGQHVFLEAAQKLAKQGVRAHYQVIGAPLFGEHSYEERLRQLAQPLGNAVEFTGFRADVPDLMRNLDVFVHASVTPEPFGQVVVEAMAEGVPVIGSDGGGVREIITHGENGLLSPMGDADALAHELAGLLADPERASHIAHAGWERVRAQFTARHTARALESVYDSVWETRPPRRSGAVIQNA